MPQPAAEQVQPVRVMHGSGKRLHVRMSGKLHRHVTRWKSGPGVPANHRGAATSLVLICYEYGDDSFGKFALRLNCPTNIIA